MIYDNYNVTIFNRKGKLYLQFWLDGKKKQRSTRLDDTPKNRKLLQKEVIPQLQAKLKSGELLQKEQEKQLNKDIAYYAKKYIYLKEHLKTYFELSAQVDTILEHFKGDIDKIKRGHIKDWVATLLKTKKPKTVRKYINVLANIFDVAIEYEIIKENPAKNIKLPTHIAKEKEPFSPQEVQKLLTVAKRWFKNYLAIAFFTGMRPGEIIALTKDDINIANRTINVSKARKGGKTTTPKTTYSIRQVPIFDILVPYLEDQLRNCSDHLFTNSRGRAFWDANKLHPYWRETIELSGLYYREMYVTRHTFITAMLKSGNVSVMELAQIVGHKNSTEIMQNYARFIKGEHLKISKKINPFADNLTDTIDATPIITKKV